MYERRSRLGARKRRRLIEHCVAGTTARAAAELVGDHRNMTASIYTRLRKVVPVSVDDWLQHLAPAIGGVHVAGTQGAPLQITELVEHEQGMVTGAAEMAVVGGSFLIAMGRADAAVHVEDDHLRRSCTRSIQTPDRAVNATRLSSVASYSVSNLPIWLVEAAIRSGPSWSTMERMTGSRDSRSASLTSS